MCEPPTWYNPPECQREKTVGLIERYRQPKRGDPKPDDIPKKLPCGALSPLWLLEAKLGTLQAQMAALLWLTGVTATVSERDRTPLKLDEDHLRRPGRPWRPGIEIDEIDLIAYKCKSPEEALESAKRDGVKLIGTELLTLLYQFPELMKFSNKAYPLAGLQVASLVPETSPWARVPVLKKTKSGELILVTELATKADPNYVYMTVKPVSGGQA